MPVHKKVKRQSPAANGIQLRMAIAIQQDYIRELTQDAAAEPGPEVEGELQRARAVLAEREADLEAWNKEAEH